MDFNLITIWNEKEHVLPAGEGLSPYMDQLEELDQTLQEMREYVNRYPEDEMGVLHLQQFERKRAILAGQLMEVETAMLTCSMGNGEFESLQLA
ncbi:hypothetical protein [Paenibacillus herberti]|uniref:Uncharacterized protein n=1 Tax=Paenibacillus herberti TaxID=1619309 RepID=A0A229NZK2_9BACL|nr:hypothetical protein [Paenibacillus herberti]OXM15191.1 hypothetical protein CGZ75_00100 [Paenibacillus herberti]